MKRYIIIFFLFLLFDNQYTNAQTKNLPNYDNKIVRFGFTVGLGSMDYYIFRSDKFYSADSIYAINTSKSLAFLLGPIVDLRLGEFVDMRLLIDLSLGQRTVTYTIPNADKTAFNTYSMVLASYYLESPLLIKYKSTRINNYRYYLITGINPKYDLGARKKYKEDELPKFRVKPFDIYYEIGFGVDYYLYFFKLSTEIKYGIGFFDVLIQDGTQYTSTIDRLTANMITLSFHFQ